MATPPADGNYKNLSEEELIELTKHPDLKVRQIAYSAYANKKREKVSPELMIAATRYNTLHY